MKIGRILPLIIAILFLPCMASSKGVSFSTALQVARNYCIQKGYPAELVSPGDSSFSGSATQLTVKRNMPLSYMFRLNNHMGFIIIAADDRIRPVLGYSFAGNFAGNFTPPAYAGFMQELEREILRVVATDAIPSDQTLNEWRYLRSSQFIPERSMRDLLPLIKTSWDQGCFYNAGCPNDTAAPTTCLHALAGSGATAMAQIMKYYQYPVHGAGEHGYTHPKYGIQYANFSATNYIYSNMPDSVIIPNEMVATLIYQCGVAQNMDYGVTISKSDSAAVDTALVKYFSYPGTAAWKWKKDYTATEWLSLLTAELDASHPLLYQGNANGTDPYFFICDGYQGSGYFHFNWGWGGAFDGYFSLDNLTPGSSNFTSGQGAIFNLAPTVPIPDSYIMDFETVPDFSLTFNDWTVNDVDKHDTYGITNYTFPHQSEAMAFLSFNPAQVTPSMATDQAMQPHGGQRFGACFNANPPSNDDWFISPQIQLGTNGSFSFWVKSYNDVYGLDNYTVAVSVTDNNPGSFTTISGLQPLQTTLTWAKKTFSLSDYNGQTIYVAIHCVSNDHFLMMIDDLEVKRQGSSALQADFAADKTFVMAGESVNFTDQSVGSPTSWKWTFTGGIPATSILQNPSAINYPTPGNYTVKLKISNGTVSDSIIQMAYITVSGYPSSMSLDFESLADFTLSFSPWTVIDVKGGNTYGINQPNGNPYLFLHSNEPMAYICFNPSKTTPAMTDLTPHSGQKLGCCFSSYPPMNPNNKWLISPKMSLGIDPRIEFWVKSYATQFGNEMYNVAVSTTDLNPASFIPLTTSPESSPADWTQRSYNLSAYSNQNVYIGIQCVTNDSFIFMLDDISITSTVGLNDLQYTDQLILYPNPATDHLTLKSGRPFQSSVKIDLINTLGELIRSWSDPVFQGSMTLDIHDIPQGLYILQITDGKDKVNHKITKIN